MCGFYTGFTARGREACSVGVPPAIAGASRSRHREGPLPACTETPTEVQDRRQTTRPGSASSLAILTMTAHGRDAPATAGETLALHPPQPSIAVDREGG
jgi:hypothetical protein